MSPQPVRRNILRRILGHTQAMLGAGLLVIIPIAVTAVILKFFFDLLDPILQPLLGLLPGPRIPGLGLISLMVAVYLVGLVATQVVGRRLVNINHRIMERIPALNSTNRGSANWSMLIVKSKYLRSKSAAREPFLLRA